jgi:hypothetical protein
MSQALLNHWAVKRAVRITKRAAEFRKKNNLPDDQPITREALIKAGVVKPPTAAKAAPAAASSAARGPFAGSPFGSGLLGGFGKPKSEPKPEDKKPGTGDPA